MCYSSSVSTGSPLSFTMTSAWTLLSLIWLQSVHATTEALVFQSPSSVRVTPGSVVTLTCDITQMGGQCSQVVWLHVGPLKTLRLCHWYSTHTQTRTRCLLEITSAKPKDAGSYYCVYMNGIMLMVGNGTTLAVTEPTVHSPVVELLVPLDGRDDSSTPVPLFCLVSGLEEPSQARVDWEVEEMEGLQELTPKVLPETEAGVIGVQVYIPGETWARGAEVSCVLSVKDLSIKKSVSSMMGTSSQCVLMTSFMGAVCIILLVVTMMLTILLSCQRRQARRRSEQCLHTRSRGQVSPGVHYASLRFEAAGRRNVHVAEPNSSI